MALRKSKCTTFTSKHLPMMKANGTRWLLFSDLPELIKTHVHGRTTLDYGCGQGASTLFLKSCNLDVEGVDISEDMIYYAQQSDPKGKYTVIQSGSLPGKQAYFDLISTSMVLPYISSKLELNQVLQEFYKCLKIGGTVIITVNSANLFKYDWTTIRGIFKENLPLSSGCIAKAEFKDSGVIVYACFWSENDYRQAITNAGLDIVCVHHVFGRDSDPIQWTIETEISPFTMYVAKKKR